MKKFELKYVFLLPIILTMIVSISHVTVWYDLANPFVWSIFMSISIEIGAMSALVATTNKIKGGVWFMFIIVTFIQMIGNIFFSYKEIDANGDLFKSWMELTNPVWEALGSDTSDIIASKRWLAFLEGGLLPIISLTSLHFFIKYDDGKPPQVEPQIVEVIKEVPVEKIVEVPVDREVIVEKIVKVPVQTNQTDDEVQKYWEEIAQDFNKQEIVETTTTTEKKKKTLNYVK